MVSNKRQVLTRDSDGMITIWDILHVSLLCISILLPCHTLSSYLLTHVLHGLRFSLLGVQNGRSW